MNENITERVKKAMRTAIRKHKKAKLLANANCEDNFCLAVIPTAKDALLDLVIGEIETKQMIDWYNEITKKAWPFGSLVLATCREMYHVLRK